MQRATQCMNGSGLPDLYWPYKYVDKGPAASRLKRRHSHESSRKKPAPIVKQYRNQNRICSLASTLAFAKIAKRAYEYRYANH